MNLCDCIEMFDLSEGITIEELKKHPSLADAVYYDSGVDYINRDKLIAILFKAVQELKTEIDTLKN